MSHGLDEILGHLSGGRAVIPKIGETKELLRWDVSHVTS